MTTTAAPEASAAGEASVVLGVGGGIAAYKAAELLRLFTESGHRVRVVPTASALRFVGAPTWAALSGQPVADEVWSDVHEVPHVRLGQRADLVVVAPATADLLAKAAHGLADDLLTNTLLTARCPVLLAPAMHTEMWEHPATVANVATLRGRGVLVIEPASGRLTGADTGRGRLPDPAEIFAVARGVLARGGAAPRDLTGRRVVVTAGGTREPLDPVRFLGNRSSGKQGYAFARTAAARGAQVTLIAANVTLPDPAGAELVRVGTTEELRQATLAAAAEADAVVMAAAPADFRPARYADQKIKKSDHGAAPVIELVTNPDIAAELGQRRRAGQVLVVFAAETARTADAEANARAKLARKGADLIVVNEVGPDRVFGADHNTATVLGADGSRQAFPEQSKEGLADRVWDLVVTRLSST
ncbi:bifunctional phosphopantothenoylcysteine decarboxylase/phosphopantothenate--cysteine ligase CoaBC [Solwaraspora sp. WMMD1047]|uniref:bifunctional phosphopantothenoylcysteine decarboxylase/phosphopantothenate--cysteine ligase CoaBC n=1 Tax=Solwaraspora sp. WMMD1047 TaxID=3016102 RepID=UPI00241739E6|nr:bifunctional phosphopantothenoylcysteine decarboxylase/phosphopantothenate--cysteine ligase CoaBC [Solwaraspora sp. WMMD1047]MDG4830368.1 bifunctional phosphopantothenoylcysteine decarboxylase/phosphopantothenate--cysteine ligase CoaBC [Solwaraspora sp. WMMD1047]